MKTLIKHRLALVLLASLAGPWSTAYANETVAAANLSGPQLEQYVTKLLKDTGVTPEAIRSLIISRSDEMQAVVDGARAAGATDNLLVEECFLELPKDIVPDFVRAAIAAQVPPAEILEACMNAVPVEESFDVVFAAMQAADPLELSSIIRVAIAHYGTEDFDGNQILVSSLIAGDFLNPDLIPAGCSTACMEEIAANTLEFLAELQAPLPPSEIITDVASVTEPDLDSDPDSEPPVDDDVDFEPDPEPPLSDS